MLEEIIAVNVKYHRQNRQWSLSKTAEETGVSKAMLGQIERQESSPTMATIWKIARGMKLSLSELIEPQAVEGQLADKQPRISVDGVLDFTVLFSFDPILKSEMFAHRLASGKTQLSNGHQQGVIEDIIIISGELEMLIDDKWKPLKAGDTLRFKADKAHGYRNLTGAEVVFHNIIHYP